MSFKPERFLDADGQAPERDPRTLSFGFGRRICPGRVLADSTIYLTVVQSLAAFKVGKAVENGEEIDPVVQFLPGVISHPMPYKISVKPRSPDHEALIRSVETAHPWKESDSSILERVKR
jgi:cytochrome P450